MVGKPGRTRGPRFSETDDAKIIAMLDQGHSMAAIAAALARTEASIKKRIDRIRAKQHDDELNSGPSPYQIRAAQRKANNRFARAMRRAGYGVRVKAVTP